MANPDDDRIIPLYPVRIEDLRQWARCSRALWKVLGQTLGIAQVSGSVARSLQRDVRAFFGSHAAALEEARRLIFSAGTPAAIVEGVAAAVAGRLGAMRDGNTFCFAVPCLDRLPPAVRLRVLCGGLLRGGVEGADFIDLKLDSPRLTFIACLDPSARLPVVSERTRVDLARARVSVDQPDGMVIYLKGRYLAQGAPDHEEQLEFDRKLLASRIVTSDGTGPRLADLQEFMRKRGGATGDKGVT